MTKVIVLVEQALFFIYGTDKTKLKLDREVGGECFLETFEFKMVH